MVRLTPGKRLRASRQTQMCAGKCSPSKDDTFKPWIFGEFKGSDKFIEKKKLMVWFFLKTTIPVTHGRSTGLGYFSKNLSSDLSIHLHGISKCDRLTKLVQQKNLVLAKLLHQHFTTYVCDVTYNEDLKLACNVFKNCKKVKKKKFFDPKNYVTFHFWKHPLPFCIRWHCRHPTPSQCHVLYEWPLM